MRTRKHGLGPLTTSFGHLITILREGRKLSIKTLASETHMTPERIRTLESGVDDPSLQELQQLGTALERTEAELIALTVEGARQP